jgi:Cytosolic domain of 10TM putative phosphate transporter
MSSLDEFGIGISLYFKTLKAIAVVMLICAFINLVAIYENKKFNLTQDDVDTYNALFPDGEQLSATPNELIGSAYGATAGTLKFYKQVAADIAITCVIGTFLLFSIKAQSKIVEEIDKAQQTTQDYSICVKHPPNLHKEGPNAGQPYTVDHFKEFFKKFGEVSSVTMVKKNGCLLRAIAEREVYIDTLDKLLIQQGESTTASEEKGFVSNSLMVSLGFINSDIPSLKKKIEECRTKVIQLSSLEYPTHQVFVTFNSQADQVKCLKNTFHSTLMKWQGVQASHSSYFDGELLTIRESHEPSDIIYENNDKGFWPTYLSRAISYFIVAALMVTDYYLINALLKTGGVAAPIVITLINMILPMAMKYLTNEVEIHHDNAHRQSSLLLKLVAVRCINAAVLIYLAAPFEDTFQLARIRC